MTVEIQHAISSITEAKLVARKAEGIIPIAPCVQIDSEEQAKICPNLDKIKLCTDPDGVLSDGKVLQCPKQRGSLTLININGSGEKSPNGTSQEPKTSTLKPSRPLVLDRKKRRPYFVR